MFTRPLVGVQSGDAKTKSDQTARLPAVFQVPIRPDLINHVHTRVAKNHRQPYAVSKYAGHDSSAESWGTGRAVARIPRVAGGGTHRAGQGAFGNMCRGGRRFAPTKIWRRWHRKVNVNEKRYAVASAVAASAVPALVMARGHRIDTVAEIPLVVDNKAIDNVDKTSKALALLKALNAHIDVERVKHSHHIRAGVGKMRNRRYVQRRGPLVVYNENGPVLKALRNIPGVDVCNVNRLNILKLAPGGHIGRFIIWTKDAFEKLNSIFGTTSSVSAAKKGYKLPRTIITNADLGRLINSDEIHSVIRGKKQTVVHERKKNPLRNGKAMARLNPLAVGLRRRAVKLQEQREKKKAALLESKRKGETKPAPVDAKKKAAKKALTKSRKVTGKKIYARITAK